MSGFGTGSNSNGQFWFGGNTFPGFLFKKNMGVGGRRSTKFNPGGNITCNSPTYLYNKYKPGAGGIGASSMSNRRAKNRLATVCGPNQCFPCYNTLGQYSNYTHNPNGFIPCPAITSTSSSTSSSVTPTPSGAYTLTYDANGGTGTAPAPTTSYSSGTNIPVLDNTGPFTRQNSSGTIIYTFGGWNTASVYGIWGTYYPAGSALTMPYADTILYAQWYNPAGPNYQVIYDDNGSTSGTVPGTANYKVSQGVSITGNTGTLVKSGSTFYGWNTAANGLGTAYPVPVTSNGFTMPAQTVTLYAQWVDTSTTYPLIYDGNGNTGTPFLTSTSYPSGASASVIPSAPTYKSGYTFIGWNTLANGLGTNYTTGASILMSSSKTLYAQWVGGVVAKSCLATGSQQGGWSDWGDKYLYRDNTNNTMTIIIQDQYSDATWNPCGTGNAYSAPTANGNLLNAYSRVVLSQVLGVYQMDIIYKTNWTLTSETQTGTISLGSTYWPTTQTINDITIITSGLTTPYYFSTDPYPSADTPPIGSVPSSGCFSRSSGPNPTGPIGLTNALIIEFYINFSNGTTTRVAVGIQNRWNYTVYPVLPTSLVYNRTRIELANGPTTTSSTFVPTITTAVNTA
jgi:uncharacterized repeat protein (TIGR02543 family)